MRARRPARKRTSFKAALGASAVLHGGLVALVLATAGGAVAAPKMRIYKIDIVSPDANQLGPLPSEPPMESPGTPAAVDPASTTPAPPQPDASAAPASAAPQPTAPASAPPAAPQPKPSAPAAAPSPPPREPSPAPAPTRKPDAPRPQPAPPRETPARPASPPASKPADARPATPPARPGANPATRPATGATKPAGPASNANGRPASPAAPGRPGLGTTGTGTRPVPATGPKPVASTAGGEGLNVRTAGADFVDRTYLENIIRQVRRYFRPPAGSTTDRASVRFWIERDGSVKDMQIAGGSGSYTFRAAAMEAVETAGRDGAFGPLPHAFGGDRLAVTFDFSPPR
ncbi:MAG TPA: TonB family protein [Longimicrobiaceae bacterium]|jgi:TonB family protein|nr:TonB family protein [Longimicrobiaceae bacterium]